MNKPKIIISSYDDLKNPYYAGGGAVAVHQVAKRLTKKFKITVITGKYPGYKNEIVDGVKYKRVGIKYFGPQVGQFVFQLCLPFLVRKEKYDLWVESFTPPFSTNFLQLFTKKPVIGLVHMLSAEDMKRKYKLPFDLVENIGLHFYKHIIVTTDVFKNKISKINPKAEIVVIPNGIERIQRVASPKGEYILYLGRIEVNQKGLDLLLKSYSKIADKIKYPLYIAGGGSAPEEKKLEELVRTLKLDKKVKLLGNVRGQEKDELFKSSAFVVVPSRFETFSMVALEAMSFGKAVLSFDIEGLGWLPENSSVKVPKFNINKFSNEMLRLSKDKKEVRKLGEKGLNFSKGLTWDKVSQDYESFISSVGGNFDA